MPNTMGHIKRSIVLVLFTQLLGYSEPKTIVFNSYSSEPAHQPESSRNVTSEQQPIAGSAHRQEASESSGRGFSSGGGSGVPSFPFSIHPDFLSKPVQVARPNNGYKTPKYIVYPSYSQNTANSVPYYNAPVAMDRFAPGEAYGGTIYKLKKQKQPAAAPFASIPAASFNSPVSVPVPSALRPAASDNSPVSVPAPPSGPPSPPGPPPSQPDQPIFVPTPVPNSGEDSSPSSASTNEPILPTSPSSTMDASSEIVLFPPNSHTGYLPPLDKKPSSDSYKPSSDLFQFPPNTNATYPVGTFERSKNPVTSYLPPPSGDITVAVAAQGGHSSYKGTAELYQFPPNVNTSYLPPDGNGDADSTEHTGTSYGAAPSGDPRSPANLKPVPNNEWVNPTGSVQPSELHRFPPNTMANYLPPDGPNSSQLPSATSYIPPPSGDPQAAANLKPAPSAQMPPSPSGNFKFPPNIHSDYLPPSGKESPPASVTSYLPPPSGNPNSPVNLTPPSPYRPPYMAPAELYKFPPNVHSPYLPPSNRPPSQNNAVTSYLPPASGIPGDDAIGTISVGPGKPQYLPPSYSDNRPPMQQIAPMMAPQQMNKMPPQMAMPMASAPAMDGPPSGPPSGMDADYDHHHHDHHHHEHDFPYFTGFDHDHYPDFIFDHDHDHHHHHDEPTTTPAPPPPPPPAPETPRLKNYSYYYLSRTLWYVPLYFTLYFTVYVAILIIRSIARHKVNLPNQWVGNTRSFGSIRDLSNKEVQEKANMMAAFAMRQIEDFREKYL
uniref:uncharacterized protein LOC120959707 isoform X1 n=1 Tax=Anopheles coluzzii TaxID=1518534 RepID=UPI0020FFB3D0|nr:uncharacterized protein LOC120959707 isoform X1 [Anopheles coluzzii]